MVRPRTCAAPRSPWRSWSRGKGPTGFDAGRAAQNMMLAAWGDGIGSCPNGIANPEALAAVLGHDKGTKW